MSAIQTLSAPQISRIDFQHSTSNLNYDSYPCRLHFTAVPTPGSVSTEVITHGYNERPGPHVLLTHGAESQLDNPTLDAFAEGLARTHTVLCFENRGSVQQRAATFKSLLDDFPSVTAFGGKSKGSVAAVEASLNSNMKKLILFSLPLSYMGSSDPGRDLLQLPQDLLQLPEDFDVLFIGGDKDELCLSEDLAAIRKKIKARSWRVQIESADHGIRFETEKRRSVCEFVGKMAGRWLNEDASAFSKTEKTADVLVGWDESERKFNPEIAKEELS